MYTALKFSHVALAALSLGLFALRGGMLLLSNQPLRHPVWRRVPPVVDTLLLLCGIGLAALLRLNPLTTPWFGVKLLCVALYIALGILAFRSKAGRGVRLALFLAALGTFGFIVSVAIAHDPRGIVVLMDPALGAVAP
ncbi:MAG: SirB2 family protein [Bacillota bacterium]